MNKIKAFAVSSSLALLGLLFSASHAFAQYAPASSTEIVDNLTTDVGTVFGAVIVGIVSFLAGLIALGMGIRYFKRWVGRK